MRIGKEIALQLRKAKIEICNEFYQNMMSFSNYAQLATMYFRGSDWSMENDFPNINILRKHKGGLLPCGMLTDVSGTYSNQRYLGVFGDSDVNLNYDQYSVAQIIIRHNTKAKIVVKDESKIQINLLDKADVHIDCEDEAQVNVYQYSNDATVTFYGGKVKVIKSEFKK